MLPDPLTHDEHDGEDRYRILTELSDGSIVYCYLAEDTKTGERVIVREVPKSFFRGSGFSRFENEARLTSGIRCDSYSQPLEFAIHGEYLRGVYSYVTGSSLTTRFRQQPLAADELMLLARELLTALQAVHEIGVVHRDIRPSNIIIRPDGRSVLCGYVPLWRPDVFGHDDRLGRECASYTSPELSGIIDHDIGEASDLYSLGYVLDAALAGGPAFDGEVNEILYKHMTADPDPGRYSSSTPNVVVQFIEKLTRKEPRDRYQSAKAALYDVDQVLDFLNRGASVPDFVIGGADQRTKLIDPALVGRDEQIGVLEKGLDHALSGGSRQVLMFSPSGLGKTRLLTEVSRIAARKGFLILHGRSSQHGAQEPSAPWLQMIDQFAKLLTNDEQRRLATAQRMKDYREEVVTAMPNLAKVLGWSGRQLGGPDELGQGRIIAAFRTLITGIGTPEASVMLTLDDCQWLDDQSLRVLSGICDADSKHLFLFAVARPSEGVSDKLNRELEVSAKFSLGPISDDAVRQLAESMAGPLPMTALEVVREYADGSPFMAAAVLRGMVESGVLTAEGKQWRVNDEKLGTFQAAEDAGQILVGRLSQLPGDARDLLAAGAVIGKDFNVDAAADLAKMSPDTAAAAIKLVRQQRLIWSRPDSTVSFVHDKIRETVLGQLSDDVIRSMHGQLGRRLEITEPYRVFDLAYHFDAAAMHDQALPYALKAAETARKSFSLASAEQQLLIATRAFQHAPRATRHHVEMMMSDVLMLQGEYESSTKWLDDAATSALTNTDEAAVALKRGELSFKRGNKDRAVAHYEAALTRLGEPVCSNVSQLWWSLSGELLRQLRNSLFPSVCGRRGSEPDEADQMSLSLYSRIAHAYWYTRDKYYTLWAHLRGMNLSECYQPTRYMAQSYSEHAPVMTLLRWQSRGIDYAKRSLRIRQSQNDLWGQGQSRNFLSILLYSFSRFDDCIDQARQAVAILERTGDFWEVHIARYQLAASLYRIGELEEAIEHARTNYQSALERGDYQATGNIVAVWSRASMGEMPLEVIEAELARDVYDPQRICQVKLAQGVRDYYQGRFAEAATVFEEAIALTEQAGVTNTYVSPCYPWLCSALRRQFSAQPSRTKRLRSEHERKLLRAARKSLSIGKCFTNELPHALREYAAACAICGHTRKAKRYFQRSLDEAQRQQASIEHAQTVVLRAEYADELGWSIDQQEHDQAIDLLSRLRLAVGSVNEHSSISLLDRFDSLLEAGRKIATSVLPHEIYQEACDAAQRILRGEHVLLVLKDKHHGELTTFPEDQVFDRQLVLDTEADKSTIVRDKERCVDRGVTTERNGTFLCSPIDVGGQTVAFLYLTNTRFSGLFGDDEIRIADYLTSAAGAALEKADGFQQLQDLNLTLEQKVQDRTAAVVEHSNELERTANELRAAQEKLQHAKDVAEAANASKSEFLARMSHEIRTPITAVLGFTELLLRGVITNQDDRARHLQTIHSNGTHLLHLLNDILDLSKIEADRIEVEQVACMPSRLLGDVVASLRSKAIQKGIDLNLEISGPVPETILSDPTRLRQIVTNVIGNAIKFTDQGGVKVDLNTTGDGHDPGQLVITVEDSGIGMTSQQMSRIFEPFAQADTSTTRKYGGTGLGLSISQRLAEALGGLLDITSQPGEGTTVVLKLAIDCPGDTRILSPEEATAGVATTRFEEFGKADLRGIRVLVVDDGDTNRDLLTLLLNDSGAEVIAATNGQQALDLLLQQEQVVDLVLMDMQMPVMDGYTATQELRQHGFDLPIIAMTANAMTGDDAKCRQAGCSDYLPKPLDLRRLLEMVGNCSSRSASADTASQESTESVDAASGAETAVGPSDPQHKSHSEESADKSTSGDSILPGDWLREFACDMIDRVTDTLPMMLQACDEGAWEKIERQAHWIKGTGGTVGLARLSELAGDCESAVRESQADRILETIEEMRSFVAQAQRERSRQDDANKTGSQRPNE